MAGTTVENSWSGSQLYMQSANDGADQTAVNGWLTNAAARRLLAAGGQDLDALQRAAREPRLPRRAAAASGPR